MRKEDEGVRISLRDHLDIHVRDYDRPTECCSLRFNNLVRSDHDEDAAEHVQGVV